MKKGRAAQKAEPKRSESPQAAVRSRATHEEILKLHKRRDFADLFRIEITVGELRFEQSFDEFRFVGDREQALYSKTNLAALTQKRIKEYSASCEEKHKERKPYYAMQCDVCNYLQFKTTYTVPVSGAEQSPTGKTLTFHRAQNIGVSIWIVPGQPVADDEFMFELFRSEDAPYDIRTPPSFPEQEGILSIYNNVVADFIKPPIPGDPSHVVFCIDHSNAREWRVMELAFELPHALFLALMDAQLTKPPPRAGRA